MAVDGGAKGGASFPGRGADLSSGSGGRRIEEERGASDLTGDLAAAEKVTDPPAISLTTMKCILV